MTRSKARAEPGALRVATGSEASPALAPKDWAALLARELDCPVEVRYGQARRSVVRAERSGRLEPGSGRRALVVHLNAMFAGAPRDVQDALVRWLRSGRRARRACLVLDEWIDRSLEQLHRERPRALSLKTVGRAHDLGELARELGETEFAPEIERGFAWPRITWGRSGRSRTHRSLRLGSFDYASRVVRIHPVLDQLAVPRWFVRYVLFHELLHAVLGDRTRVGGRRAHHGPEFRAREAAFVDCDRALEWEREHISALVVSARTGKPMGDPSSRARKRSASDAPASRPRGLRGKLGWVQRLLF